MRSRKTRQISQGSQSQLPRRIGIDSASSRHAKRAQVGEIASRFENVDSIAFPASGKPLNFCSTSTPRTVSRIHRVIATRFFAWIGGRVLQRGVTRSFPFQDRIRFTWPRGTATPTSRDYSSNADRRERT